MKKEPRFIINSKIKSAQKNYKKDSGSFCAEDIYKFIEDVVLKEQDIKAEERRAFVEENLIPIDRNVAKSMYKDVLKDLGLEYKENKIEQ